MDNGWTLFAIRHCVLRRRSSSRRPLLRLRMLRVPKAKCCSILTENSKPIPCAAQFAGARLHNGYIRRRSPLNGDLHLLRFAIRMGFCRHPNMHVRRKFLPARESHRPAHVHYTLSTRFAADDRVS